MQIHVIVMTQLLDAANSGSILPTVSSTTTNHAASVRPVSRPLNASASAAGIRSHLPACLRFVIFPQHLWRFACAVCSVNRPHLQRFAVALGLPRLLGTSDAFRGRDALQSLQRFRGVAVFAGLRP